MSRSGWNRRQKTWATIAEGFCQSQRYTAKNVDGPIFKSPHETSELRSLGAHAISLASFLGKMVSYQRRLLSSFTTASNIPCFIVAWVWALMSPYTLLANEAATVQQPSFQQPQAGYEYTFPQDHGAHDNFSTEWWYFTGHLFTSDHRQFGYELTFFRRAIDDERVRTNLSRWAIRQLYLAHFAVTDEENKQFQYAEKISRAGLGKAGAAEGRLETWIDQWSVTAINQKHQQFQLEAKTDTFAVDLIAELSIPPVIHGLDGVSRKGTQTHHSSHYYSLTRLQTSGSLRIQHETFAVTGLSWMDHEFASSDLEDGLVGWDWFSMQLKSGHDIMIYGLRREDGSFAPSSSGTLVFPDGTSQHLSREDLIVTVLDYWESPKSGARYPSQWTISIPTHQIQVHITPRMADQELRTGQSTQVTYWEGAVDISGTLAQQAITGLGYVELTGYAEPYKPSLQ